MKPIYKVMKVQTPSKTHGQSPFTPLSLIHLVSRTTMMISFQILITHVRRTPSKLIKTTCKAVREAMQTHFDFSIVQVQTKLSHPILDR